VAPAGCAFAACVGMRVINATWIKIDIGRSLSTNGLRHDPP